MKFIPDISIQTLRGCHAIVYYDAGGQHLLEVNEILALLFRRAEAGDFSAESLAPVLEEQYGISHGLALEEAAKAIDVWMQYRLIAP